MVHPEIRARGGALPKNGRPPGSFGPPGPRFPIALKINPACVDDGGGGDDESDKRGDGGCGVGDDDNNGGDNDNDGGSGG